MTIADKAFEVQLTSRARYCVAYESSLKIKLSLIEMAKLFLVILFCISSVTSDTVSGQRGDGVQVVKIDETTRQFDLANKLDRQAVERGQLESLRAQEETDHSAAAQATDRYVSLFEKQFGTISAPIESEFIYKKHVEFMDSAETLYRQLGGATSSPHFDTFQRDVKARYSIRSEEE
ncbi:hypothetical protein HDE_00945 [Halotydeus destructor]|nr:hypothetical protein HDE_00945 [Halotydeus destructor]